MKGVSAEQRPLLRLIEQSQLLRQGAEAKVYKASLCDSAEPLLLKHRFKKSYRHASLDAQLTKSRITQEARCLVRAAKNGVAVPGVRCVDLEAGILGLEWIEGQTVRDLLGGLPEDEDDEPHENGIAEVQASLQAMNISEDSLLSLIGNEIAKLHAADIVHGDLTTSNMMVRPSGEVVLIDFGLAHVSTMIEDKAVDLYVLERALISTHPEPELSETPPNHRSRFERILAAYAAHLGKEEWKRIGGRLAEVQLRGRKRSMVG